MRAVGRWSGDGGRGRGAVKALSPENWDGKNLYEHGLNRRSECSHCSVRMVEADGSVYVSLLGWMCEACYMGDTKPQCVARPYRLPMKRARSKEAS